MILDKGTFDLLGKGIALAGLLFTAATYAYNLHIDRQKERYAQTMSLVDRYDSDGVRDHENSLAARLLYYTGDGLDLNDPALFPNELFKPAMEEVLFGYTAEATAEPVKPLLPEFMGILDFYARVSFCMEAKICEATIFQQYFCPRVRGFAERNRRLIDYYETFSGAKDLSGGLDRLTRQCAASKT